MYVRDCVHMCASLNMPETHTTLPLSVQLDVVDPGTLLMWIFGLIISVLWILYLFNREFFCVCGEGGGLPVVSGMVFNCCSLLLKEGAEHEVRTNIMHPHCPAFHP